MPTLLRQTITITPIVLVVMVIMLPGVANAANITGGIPGVLWDMVNGFFGMIAGLAGVFLNFAVNQFVVNFGANYVNTGIGYKVDTLWVTVRDIFNITFIFGLVYIGFKMILNSGDSSTRKWLINLIIAALLVNFSLFITKFVVDFSNSLATTIVSTFPTTSDPSNPGINTSDVAGPFIDAMGLTSIWKVEIGCVANTPNCDASLSQVSGATFGYIFGAVLVFLIATFVFAAGAFLLMIRFIVLHIYMVLSPFLFLGFVFPQFMPDTKKHWRAFFSKAFVAPIYILMIFFALHIVTGMSGALTAQVTPTGNETLADTFTGNASTAFAASFAPFMLAAGFLLAAVIIANKLGAEGSSTVMKIGNNLKGRAQRGLRNTAIGGAKLATYPAREGLRKDANRAGNFANRKLDAWQTSDSKLKRAVARSRVVDESVRGTAASLKSTKAGFKYSIDEENKKRSAISSRADNLREIKLAEGIDPNRKDLTDPEIETLNDARKAAGRLGQKEIEGLIAGGNMNSEQLTSFVGMLKAATVAKAFESAELSDAEKKQLGEAYENALTARIEPGEGNDVSTEALAKVSDKEIEVAGDDFVRKYAHLFTESQMDGIKKSDGFSEQQKDRYKTVRKDKRTAFATSDNADTRAVLFRETELKDDGTVGLKEEGKPRKASEIATLPADAFMIKDAAGQYSEIRPDARTYITADVLKQMGRNVSQGKPGLSEVERQRLALELLGTRGVSTGITNYLKTNSGKENFLISEPDIEAAERGREEWGDPEV